MIVEQQVYFMIQSDEFDPGQITQYVGVEPTRSEAKESRLGRKSGRLLPPRHEWMLDSGLAETTSLDEQVEAVMNQLAGAWDRIRELTAGGATATLVMLRSFEPGEHSSPRGLVLDAEAISSLQRAGADLWIDEYDLS
ncbi:DUF4279 domain-containing protein [Nonomuraea sp. C10]|uniref:DUF4279 domain-containing protein n=1 Tax=Nonomuraea sp. C10 TaxID=2600577 RepID=UPI0011CDC3EE|nr:DUF4279 domain-containing protein [Nonomuraea sp. C10]TXK35721.1 DUF4279 domain-containing protein [Nonomuraea sp. C10]